MFGNSDDHAAWYLHRQEVDARLDEARKALQEHKDSVADVERTVTLLLGELQKLAAKREHLKCAL